MRLNDVCNDLYFSLPEDMRALHEGRSTASDFASGSEQGGTTPSQAISMALAGLTGYETYLRSASLFPDKVERAVVAGVAAVIVAAVAKYATRRFDKGSEN